MDTLNGMISFEGNLLHSMIRDQSNTDTVFTDTGLCPCDKDRLRARLGKLSDTFLIHNLSQPLHNAHYIGRLKRGSLKEISEKDKSSKDLDQAQSKCRYMLCRSAPIRNEPKKWINLNRSETKIAS